MVTGGMEGLVGVGGIGEGVEVGAVLVGMEGSDDVGWGSSVVVVMGLMFVE